MKKQTPPSDPAARKQPVRKPLYMQVREILLERIRGGEWKPGEQIPTEPVLASQFGVSIGTLRRAVETLVAESILVRREGAGTFLTTYRDTGYWNRFLIFGPKEGGGRRYDERVLMRIGRVPLTERVAASLQVPAGTEATCLMRHFYKHQPDGSKRLVTVDEIYLHPERFRDFTRSTYEDNFLPTDSLYKFYDRVFGVVVTSQKNSVTFERITGEEAARLMVPDGFESITAWRVSRTFGRLPVEVRIHHFEAATVKIDIDIE
ncbi:GntR family transcriptional regulator [Sutterella sp.]|uniref:GntR family transcriptional regulator n=1 Tax=Sutterella sp. TaxID=1981025 RepID=UPI0026DFC4F2|nr:GntR family transcriptional regulator [Sutterella sp.]MDO5532927.1 GntR family transcriptional regulator [Sutterella sp.]